MQCRINDDDDDNKLVYMSTSALLIIILLGRLNQIITNQKLVFDERGNLECGGKYAVTENQSWAIKRKIGLLTTLPPLVIFLKPRSFKLI